MSFERYVAIGDSTTEGLDDPYPGGAGYRGWADRLAGRLAELQPDLRYANLVIRGRLAAQVHAEQLELAPFVRE
jgi:lysophospholipase L1-like esterase